ncbi:MAG: OmpA family protein [Gemmatimonadales bacterium]|nr:OmpA family protein [Gemmatimonadales bacterium]
MFNRILKGVGTLAVCLPTLALAQRPTGAHRDGSFELSIGGGIMTVDRALAGTVLVPMGIQEANPSRVVPGIVGRIGYLFNRNIALSFGAMAGKGSGATVISPFASFSVTPDINAKTNWFVLAGVGATRFSVGKSLRFFPPRKVHETASYGGHVGAGVRSMISDRLALRVEGRMQYEKYEELDPGPAYNGFASLGVSYFTGGGAPRDTDVDGVRDRRDRCPNTPRGARVDENGCPLDGDRDGVADGLDRCPDSPANTPVDANGCPRDSDRDGVADHLDRCPNTPANTRVDVNGCPPPTDTDNDGVADSIDRCPNTPVAARPLDAAGCPTDSDRDGVADYLDRCPNSPAGSLVDVNGCPRDTDHDGVADNLDRCPNTPANTRVDANGCPVIPDSDNDGVPDNRDRCPNSPIGRPVDSVGCPLIQLPANEADQMVLRVQFVTNTATLMARSLPLLDSIAVAIVATGGSRWEVQGHTDSRGSAELNRRLSQDRAQSVADYLVSKGVPRANMTATGFGPAQPVGPNTTLVGRAANRRVQLRRLPPAPTGPVVP